MIEKEKPVLFNMRLRSGPLVLLKVIISLRILVGCQSLTISKDRFVRFHFSFIILFFNLTHADSDCGSVIHFFSQSHFQSLAQLFL